MNVLEATQQKFVILVLYSPVISPNQREKMKSNIQLQHWRKLANSAFVDEDASEEQPLETTDYLTPDWQSVHCSSRNEIRECWHKNTKQLLIET